MTHPDCFKFCFRHQQDCHRPARSVAPTAASSRAETGEDPAAGHQTPDTFAVDSGNRKSATPTSHTEPGGTHLIAATGTYASCDTQIPDFTELHKLHSNPDSIYTSQAPDPRREAPNTEGATRSQSPAASHGDERKSASAADPVGTPNVSAGATPSPESDRRGNDNQNAEHGETIESANGATNGATESCSHAAERPTETQPVERNREQRDTTEQPPLADAIPRAKGASETGTGHQAPDTFVAAYTATKRLQV